MCSFIFKRASTTHNMTTHSQYQTDSVNRVTAQFYCHFMSTTSTCNIMYCALISLHFFQWTGTSANAGPHYQKLYARVTHIWGNRGGQSNRSAMRGPRPGRTSLLIKVNLPRQVSMNFLTQHGRRVVQGFVTVLVGSIQIEEAWLPGYGRLAQRDSVSELLESPCLQSIARALEAAAIVISKPTAYKHFSLKVFSREGDIFLGFNSLPGGNGPYSEVVQYRDNPWLGGGKPLSAAQFQKSV